MLLKFMPDLMLLSKLALINLTELVIPTIPMEKLSISESVDQRGGWREDSHYETKDKVMPYNIYIPSGGGRVLEAANMLYYYQLEGITLVSETYTYTSINNILYKTCLRFAPAYGGTHGLLGKVRYVRSSTAQTVSAKRTLQVCHEIVSMHNPIGETIYKLMQAKYAWGRRREVGKIGMGPGEEIASQHTKKRLQYSCREYYGEYIEDDKCTITPSKKPGGSGLNLRIIVSKTGLVFMGHILQPNLTTIPHSISPPKSDSVQEDRGNLESMHRVLNQGDRFEGLENLKRLKMTPLGSRILGHLVAGGQVATNMNISSVVTPAWWTAKTHINTLCTQFQTTYLLILEQMSGADTGAYSNKANVMELNFQTTFFGLNYAKLSMIRAKYDPDNLFIICAGEM
ncbi:hypothetical protein C8R44DRAFT_726395 [Mycena epipterygia]|nr:hypothetical protein C8R44DRAFT_726395 [Mycena epipterygia]